MPFGLSRKHRVRATFVFAVALLSSFARPGAQKDAHAVEERPSGKSAQAAVLDEGAPDLEAAVRAMVFDSKLAGARVGVALLDVETGRLLAVANEHQPLNPASNAKIYTAAAALSLLHPDHRYETILGGTVKDGAVSGSLVLRGYGDPSLTTSDLWSMAQELRGQGVRRIEGDIVVDHRFFDEQTTPPAFEQQPNEWAAFRAPISAVAVNGNTLTLSVRPSAKGEPAVAWFDPPGFVDVEGAVTTGDAGADTIGLALSANGRRMMATLSGRVAENTRVVRYTRRVEDPTLLAGYVLKHTLEQSGIRVLGEVKAGNAKIGGVLVRRQSAPLATLVQALGKASDNFYAEMIFKSIAGELSSRPSRSGDAATVVTKWLERIGANDPGVVVKNGSGLFDANRTTASSMVRVLRHVYRDPAVQPEFLAHLAIGGVDGTLHKRFREERVRRAVRAKTGTLDDAIALSGYVVGPPGKSPVAFSVLWNGVSGKAAAARAATDALVLAIARRQWR
jgi:D-alanyl-D-alanine carboxypeptidase/D-alanyl-D-alanine-endopeptidase (penicillin-binding protein 4)